MAQIIVRDLDDEVRDRLRERAKTFGRSMEAEAREILRTVVMSDTGDGGSGLGSRIAQLFEGEGLDEGCVEWHGQEPRPATFDK